MPYTRKETKDRRGGPDRRTYGRVPLTSSVEVIFGGTSVDVVICNVSLGGVLFHCNQRFELGDMMTIAFVGSYHGVAFNERVPGKIVTICRREEKSSYGLQFATTLHAERYPSLTSFVDRGRRREVSFLRDPRYGRAERKD